MGVAVWAALRQIEALRESVAFTLERGAIPRHEGEDIEKFCEWLNDQGVNSVVFRYENKTESINILESMRNFIYERCPYFTSLEKEMQRSKYGDEEDFGVHRSGVGWHSLPNFIVTSAFVRLLGACEQFELDSIKALLNYRPAGNVRPPAEYIPVEVTSGVLTEAPDQHCAFSKPLIWSWIKGIAENNVERKKIFKRVYKIETAPEGFNGLSKSEVNKYRNELYDKRNAIAHGRARVHMPLSDYCIADLFVIETVRTIAQQCFDKLKVVL